MGKVASKLSIAVLVPKEEVQGTQSSGSVDCDFDFFQERMKEKTQSLDVFISDEASRDSLLDLFIFDDTEFVWFMGGLLDDTTDETTTDVTETYEVSTDTVSESAALGSGRYGLTGIGNSEVGIAVGGRLESGIGTTGTIDKGFYATKAIAPGVAALETIRHGAAAVGNEEFGIIAQGEDSGVLTSIEKYTYETDTITQEGDFPSGLSQRTGVSDVVKGYLMGGIDSGSNTVDTIESYRFADGTIEDEGSNLPSTVARQASVGSTQHGYLMGGDDGAESDEVHKLEFGTGAISNLGAVLGSVRSNAGAGGGLRQGVISGGGNGSDSTTRSSTEKLDFETDSFSSGTNLKQGRKLHTALSSSPAVLFGTGVLIRRSSLDIHVDS